MLLVFYCIVDMLLVFYCVVDMLLVFYCIADMLLVFYCIISRRKILNLIRLRIRNFIHLNIGTLFSLRNTQGSKLMTVWLTAINILLHFIYVIIS